MTNKTCLLLGDIGVGKSTICIRYISDVFVTDYDPTIENSYRKKIVWENEENFLDILDTAGNDEHFMLQTAWVYQAMSMIFVYSITSRESFDSIMKYFNAVTRIKETHNIKCIIVGNKCDLEKERQVLYEEGEELANLLNCKFLEISAKCGSNINETFEEIIRLLFNKQNEEIISQSTETINK